MGTVADQIRAEIARKREQEAREAEIMAQPGPTAEKAEIERARRVTGITQDIATNRAKTGGSQIDLPMVEHGATLGLDVPLSGLATGLNFWGHEGSTFGERYEAGEQARRNQLNIERAETVMPTAQEVFGMLVGGGPAGGAEKWAAEKAGQTVMPAATKSVLRTGAEAAGVAGGTGAIHGVAAGEGDLSDRLMQGAKEAAIGGTAGALLGTAARALAPDAAPAAARVRAADEFDIPLTRGQATGNPAQQKAEEELRGGAKGGDAQSAMLTQQSRSEAARVAAGEDIRDRFSPYRGGTREESGELLNESIRRRGDRLRNVGGAHIERALQSGVEIDAPLLGGLRQRVDAALAGPNPQVPRHYVGVNTPIAAEALQRIDDFAQSIPTGQGVRISLAGVNQLRRNLLSLQASTPVDDAALSAIKGEVDGWMNDIVAQQGAGTLPGPGVVGPQAALDELRRGNQQYREGSMIIEPRGDVTPAQKNVSKLAAEDATGQDATKMFGVNQRGGVGNETLRTVRQISETFGANSPQMQRVRDIATTDLLDGGPQQVSNRLDYFLTENRAVAEAMYTPEQLDELARLSAVNRFLVPHAAARNASGSSYGIIREMLKTVLLGGGAVIGGQLGGELGSMGNMLGVGVGAVAGQGAGTIAANRAVNRALQPIPGGDALISSATRGAQAAPSIAPEDIMQMISPSFMWQSAEPVPVEPDIPQPAAPDQQGMLMPVPVDPMEAPARAASTVLPGMLLGLTRTSTRV